MSQSYGHYAPSGTQTPPASAAYPYGAYQASYAPHTAYPQTPGAYPYQAAGAYQYGWNYSYNYGQHPQSATAAQPRVNAATPTPAATARTSTPNPPQRSSTFSSYTPSHLRESVAAAATGGATVRGSRKQPSVRGLFTKECTFGPFLEGVTFTICSEKSHVRLRG